MLSPFDRLHAGQLPPVKKQQIPFDKFKNGACLKEIVRQASDSAIIRVAWAIRDGGPWLDALMAYLETTRDEVIDVLAHRLPLVHAYAPEGTYLMWLDCRPLGLDDAALQAQAAAGALPER